MSNDKRMNELSGELKAVEQTLAGFSARQPQVERDRLMFLAGQAQGTEIRNQGQGAGDQVTKEAVARRPGLPRSGGTHWLWPSATAALAATSLMLVVALATRSEPAARVVVQERIVMVPSEMVASKPVPSTAAVPAEPRDFTDRSIALEKVPANNYLRSREVALRMGLDALGSPRSSGGGSSGGDSSDAPTYRHWLEGIASPETLPNL
jgi:hypothetical protein